MRVLVIGGGICGLGAALLLARDGHEVTVLERDADPVPASSDASWDQWHRKGVAQFRQPHNFMPGLRLLLEAELPEIQEALEYIGTVTPLQEILERPAVIQRLAAAREVLKDATRPPIPGPTRSQLLQIAS